MSDRLMKLFIVICIGCIWAALFMGTRSTEAQNTDQAERIAQLEATIVAQAEIIVDQEEEMAELRHKLQNMLDDISRQRDIAITVSLMNWSKPRKSTAYKHEVATAMVNVAEDTGIRLAVIMAIAYVESNFRQEAVGKGGERSLMQVFPLPGRPMKRIRESASFAIRHAITNYYAPSIEMSEYRHLRRYNNNDAYVKKVLRQAEQYQKGLDAWES